MLVMFFLIWVLVTQGDSENSSSCIHLGAHFSMYVILQYNLQGKNYMKAKEDTDKNIFWLKISAWLIS